MASGVRFARLVLIGLVLPALVSCRSAIQGSPSALPSGSLAASESPVATASASAIPTDPTPSPTPVLPTLLGWRIIEIAGGFFVRSAVEGPDGWVAVGSSTTGGASLIWFSEDGANWVAAAPTPEMIFGPSLTAVIAGGPGYIAAGTDFLIDGGPPFIWTSPDGLHWTLASFGDGVTLGHVQGLAEIAGRFFAGGGLIGDGGFGTGPAVLWNSPSASDWTQTILDSGGATGAIATAPFAFAGELVSVGGAYRPYTGLVWTSGDGAHWSLVQSTGLAGAFLENAAVVGGNLVAVGEIYEDQDNPQAVPTIWASEDAQRWELAFKGACCRRIEQIAAFGDGALAIAGDVVYLSEDGVTWRLGGTIGGFDGQLVDLVVTPGLGLVAVGNDGEKNYLLVPPAN